MNRENWMTAIVTESRPVFEEHGSPLPLNVRVGCGLMSSGSRATKTVGQCWHSTCSQDEGREIWIRPDVTDSIEVAGILIHELCHAALPDGTGHKTPFAQLAKKMLLEGKPSATVAGEAFIEHWTPFLKELGDYPQAAFDASQRVGKKQTTRMLKAECPAFDMSFRTSKKWIDAANGSFTCPVCGHEHMTIE